MPARWRGDCIVWKPRARQCSVQTPITYLITTPVQILQRITFKVQTFIRSNVFQLALHVSARKETKRNLFFPTHVALPASILNVLLAFKICGLSGLDFPSRLSADFARALGMSGPIIILMLLFFPSSSLDSSPE